MNELLGWYGFDGNMERVEFEAAKGKRLVPVADDTVEVTADGHCSTSSSSNNIKKDDNYRSFLMQPQHQLYQQYKPQQNQQQRVLGAERTPLGSMAEPPATVVSAHCSERNSSSCHLSTNNTLSQSRQRFDLLPLINANNFGNGCHLPPLQQHSLSHPCDQQQQSRAPLLLCCSRNHEALRTGNDGNNSDTETGTSSKGDDDDPKALSIAVVTGSSSSSSSYATNQTAHSNNVKNEKNGK